MKSSSVLDVTRFCAKLTEELELNVAGDLWWIEVPELMEGYRGRGMVWGNAHRLAWERYLKDLVAPGAAIGLWDPWHYLIWAPSSLPGPGLRPVTKARIRVFDEWVSLDIRVSRWRVPEDGVAGEDLLHKVLCQMASTNPWGPVDPEPGAVEVEHQRHLRGWESEVRRGKTQHAPGWFLVYQPQVSLPTGRLVGAEALARWKMPDGYVLNPDGFVAWLESRGWMTLFGDWVLKTALKDWNRWMPSWNTLSLRVCVNVSAYQLRDRDFASAIRKRLEKHSMDASAIELELTEGTPWHDLDEISRQLSALRREGARVVLDDFGQGVSGLSALRNLPLDGIKIDRAFISGIETDSRRQAIVASSIQMAHNLGLTVTAEGVETEAEWARLRELDCDVVQGFWVSRPVAWEALSRFREYTPRSWAGRGDLARMDF